jgi:hypothetical protein
MARRSYADGTKVSSAKSKAEIEKLLTNYGASKFGVMWDAQENLAAVVFQLEGKHYKMMIRLPDPEDDDIKLTPTGRERHPEIVAEAWEKECRRHWRALAISLKGKLVAVDEGISTVEVEFMAYLVLPSGKTMAEEYIPQIEAAYASGKMLSPITVKGTPALELLPPKKGKKDD